MKELQMLNIEADDIDPPASDESLDRVERELRVRLPSRYRQIMKEAGGFDGVRPSGLRVVLYSPEWVPGDTALARAEGLSTTQIVIGTDAQDLLYAIDFASVGPTYVALPLAVKEKYLVATGGTLDELFQGLERIIDNEDRLSRRLASNNRA